MKKTQEEANAQIEALKADLAKKEEEVRAASATDERTDETSLEWAVSRPNIVGDGSGGAAGATAVGGARSAAR